jgi:calcineurin-like phosphoesterase family protein
MSNVYFIGDLHFGHQNIGVFRPFTSEQDHRVFLMDTWQETIGKKDLVFVMGDAAFTQEGLNSLCTLSGRKVLIRGNHDLLPIENYLGVFEEVHGLFKYKGMWLSHAPIHESELFGCTNVHGHCHNGGPTTVHLSKGAIRGHSLGAPATYFNTCAEHLPTPYKPIELHDMQERIRCRLRAGP